MDYAARELIARDALVNWCWNTEKHLKEARRLKALSCRLDITRSAWVRPTNYLMKVMQAEIDKAEPDTRETVTGGGLSWPVTYPLEFLQAIPEGD